MIEKERHTRNWIGAMKQRAIRREVGWKEMTVEEVLKVSDELGFIF